MSGQLALGLASSLLGGTAVAIVTYVSMRKKTQAEVRKIDAETEHIHAQTAKLLSEVHAVPDSILGTGGAPRGWLASGDNRGDYETGVDRGTSYLGDVSGFVRGRPGARGFATLMQEIDAREYRGERLRMTAWVKAEDVEDWAGLWMRVDGSDGRLLGFDNMADRPIRGSHSWQRYQSVLDVTSDAVEIAFGLLLQGAGVVWIDAIRFDEVGDSVPTTGGTGPDPLPTRPVNLDFED